MSNGGGVFSTKALQQQFGLGKITNPFNRIKSINETRMRSLPFFIMNIFGAFLILCALAIIGLELGYQAKYKFKMAGTNFHDPRSFALFNFSWILVGAGAIAIAAAWVGGLVMIDFWGQALVAVPLGLFSLVGVLFSIITLVLAIGRIANCNNGKIKNKCSKTCTLPACATSACIPGDVAIVDSIARACEGCQSFCKFEKGPLIAVITITIFMMACALPLMLFALLFMVSRAIQLMAAGVPSSAPPPDPNNPSLNTITRKDIISGKHTFDEYLKQKQARIQRILDVSNQMQLKAMQSMGMDVSAGAANDAAEDNQRLMSAGNAYTTNGATSVVTVRPIHRQAAAALNGNH